ncbi:protein chain elongation factor EF-Ts [Candidatus Terasakiella magnetica]|uniref:Elongation factor Ts n=1 Tax=Candidatus Terasakiella magnetica TaxID=1867952 RepID=A0A1C3RCM7_9PROT|nr:translation elongation factor Ts [Candidatus Terasakiella magnetica]SCA55021.1 protein chain elongation factor EF-Ts [Candidatus Terasakiella magnetica]
MAQITAALVKELRELSGAGMMDCKKALNENDGDIQTAQDWLRQKGLAKAAKKSGRVAAEGLVAFASGDATAAVIEVNSETDFVAKNEQFQAYVKDAAGVALGVNSFDELKAAAYPGSEKNCEETLTALVGTIGENMNLRRMEKLTVSNGVVATYMHNAAAEGLGKIAVLIGLESEGDKDQLNALGKQIAMHVAATNPLALDRDGVDATDIERERTVLIEQAKEAGKPEEIAIKMVEGRMRKFYQENCLIEQAFVIDPDNSVGKAIENLAKELGSDIKLTGYVRYELGAGIEKKEEDFAAEVAAAAGS